MKRKFLFAILILSIHGSMLGQSVDSLSMNVVTDSVTIVQQIATESPLDDERMSSDSDGFLIETIDHSTHMTVRSGGPGLIATVLRRGLASRHIGLLWEGFNIQSVVNGTYDAGLIGNTFNNSSYLSHDANSLSGNASMAGVLNLSSHMSSSSANSIELKYGSDKNSSGVFRNTIQSKSYSHVLAVDGKKHANNYRFYNGNSLQTQENAGIGIVNLNYSNKVLLSNTFVVESGIWYQKANRNIPPTKTSVFIDQDQEDENFRVSLSGKYYVNQRHKINLRSAYFNEKIIYEAPGIFSKSDADIYNLALDYINENGLSISTQYRYDVVNASFFELARKRSTTSLLMAYRGSTNFLKYNVSFRPQLIDGDVDFGTFNIHLSKELGQEMEVSLHAGRGFTLPSFNDLYWPSGGNQDLLTESSVNTEIGWSYRPQESPIESIKVSLFYNLIDNWIQWIPIGGRFEPVNQRKVRNAGIELDAKYSKQLNANQSIIATLHYAFVDSRLQKHYVFPLLEGKRTIFVPAHKVSAALKYRYGSWSITGMPIYYSRRYDTVDNSTWEDGYFVTDLILNKRVQIGKHALQASLSIENSTNTNYENISFFPMPLRVYRIGLKFNY